MKFKVGDKVRVLKTVTDQRKDYVGKIGTITRDTGPGYRWLLNISDQWLFKDEELQLVE